jgi:DnaK suppressor protein
MQYTKTEAEQKLPSTRRLESRFDDGIFIASLAVKISWEGKLFMNKRLVAELAEELKRKRTSLLSDGDHGEIAPEIVDERKSEIEEHAQTDRMAKLTSHLRERGHETLRAIDVALDRVTVGNYGICQSCGDEIKPARLKALPTATLCIDCAKDMEKKTRSEGNGHVLYSRIDFDPLEGEM